MTTKQIKIWYGILIGEIILAGLVFLWVSFWAEVLGIDSGGNWGMMRISIAGLGFVIVIIGLFLVIPGIKKMSQTYKMAHFSRYIWEATFWIMIALGLFELILRTTIGYNPEMVYEKDWGSVPIPGSARLWIKEGYGTTYYFPHGEIATPFDDGNISVVLLGDSHTEAFQVSDFDKFVSVAETSLRSEGKDVNLHNLGMSSNSIPDFIYLAPIIKQYYNPKIIVIQLSSQDFWGENGGDGFNIKHRNYFVINNRGDMELIHKNPYFSPSLYIKFTQKIMLYSAGREIYLQVMEMLRARSIINAQFQPIGASSNAILPVARLSEQLKLLKEAYSGIKVILLILPYSPNIEKNGFNFDNVEDLKIKNSAEKIGGFYIIYPQSEFEHLIAQGHLPRGFMNSLPGIGHLNIFGNRITGELLAEKILEIIE